MRDERGIVLFEVLVALMILGVAGLAIASLIQGEVRGIADLRGRERRIVEADEVLTALTLKDAHQLDLRIGRRAVDGFVTDVQRPHLGLYRLAVADSSAPEQTLLVTAVYRAGAR